MPLTKRLTIEHVMPQTLPTNWSLPLSATADAVNEQKAVLLRHQDLPHPQRHFHVCTLRWPVSVKVPRAVAVMLRS
jgi:hypothetical protein